LNGVTDILKTALEKWNDSLGEILFILTRSPEEFKGGGIWSIILTLHNALIGAGLGLLVLFFLFGVVKNGITFADIKRPEVFLRLLVQFVLAKAAVTYSMELMKLLLDVVRDITGTMIRTAWDGSALLAELPASLDAAIDSLNFMEQTLMWLVGLLAALVIIVLSFVMLMSVYGCFFKIYMHMAIAPIPIAAFAGEATQRIGVSFVRSFAAVCAEGALIVLACIIFSAFASAPPVVPQSASAMSQVWQYIVEVIFNILVLVGTIKMANQLSQKMLGI